MHQLKENVYIIKYYHISAISLFTYTMGTVNLTCASPWLHIRCIDLFPRLSSFFCMKVLLRIELCSN